MATDGPRPRSTSTSLVDGPMRERDQAPEAPCGVGTSRSAMLCAIFGDPDEIMSRGKTRTGFVRRDSEPCTAVTGTSTMPLLLLRVILQADGDLSELLHQGLTPQSGKDPYGVNFQVTVHALPS